MLLRSRDSILASRSRISATSAVAWANDALPLGATAASLRASTMEFMRTAVLSDGAMGQTCRVQWGMVSAVGCY